MAKIYNFNYALYHEDLKYCDEYLDEIVKELQPMHDLCIDMDWTLYQSQRLYCELMTKINKEDVKLKFKSLEELMQTTQRGLGKLTGEFEGYRKDVTEESESIKNQIATKTMSDEDVEHMEILFNDRLDELDYSLDEYYQKIMSRYAIIKSMAKNVREIQKAYKRGEDISKVNNPFERGCLRIVK